MNRSLGITNKITDLLLINISWWICYFLRFESNLLDAQQGLFDWYFKFSILLTFLNYYYFRSRGVYSTKSLTSLERDIFTLLKANTLAFLIFIVISYFLSEYKLSRLFMISHFLISSTLLTGFKLSFRRLLRKIRQDGSHSKQCLLIGNSEQIQTYAKKVSRNPEFGFKIKTWLKTKEELHGLNLLEIEKIKPDIIVFGVENQNYPIVNKILIDLNNTLIEIIVLPDLSNAFVGYQLVDIINGIPAILVNEPNLKSSSVIIKRSFDLILCTFGVLLISPLLLLLALLVKLTSKGPILYGQVRMGLDGREFKMWKFRSMTVGNSNKETWTVKDDPRVTPIGKIIRKTSLDELPQLFNVIIGDMSLVGPRPERPVFVNEFKQSIPTYMLRHKMKAGITGWAQINGWRGDTSIEKRIECDLYYIKNWSIWMDLWIIIMTFWKGFINKNAY
ncbi:MAG: undecaprenyl-phosphate glucose phosphotransferase [Bacteriovoracaceae bacterium]|nr:undecaprenyl-phosphate glucose phosphotransferase [Bacteriovoracaceae bacterium]